VIRRRRKKTEKKPIEAEAEPEKKISEEKPSEEEVPFVEALHKEILPEQAEEQKSSEKAVETSSEPLKTKRPKARYKESESVPAQNASMPESSEKEQSPDQKSAMSLSEKGNIAQETTVVKPSKVQVSESKANKTSIEETTEEKAKIVKQPSTSVEKTPEKTVERKRKRLSPKRCLKKKY
jgi:hypothetical protein